MVRKNFDTRPSQEISEKYSPFRYGHALILCADINTTGIGPLRAILPNNTTIAAAINDMSSEILSTGGTVVGSAIITNSSEGALTMGPSTFVVIGGYPSKSSRPDVRDVYEKVVEEAVVDGDVMTSAYSVDAYQNVAKSFVNVLANTNNKDKFKCGLVLVS